MIDLYYWTTPNGHKITIFLEEAGLPYKIMPVNIGKGEQFKPDFLAISPNNRIPAIVDHEPTDGGAPISVFESGAILLYLAEKTGQFSADGSRASAASKSAMAVLADGRARADGRTGPSLPQLCAGEDSLRDRSLRERDQRLYGVLNKRLADREFLAGEYSIADMACYPWIVPYERQGQKSRTSRISSAGSRRSKRGPQRDAPTQWRGRSTRVRAASAPPRSAPFCSGKRRNRLLKPRP